MVFRALSLLLKLQQTTTEPPSMAKKTKEHHVAKRDTQKNELAHLTNLVRNLKGKRREIGRQGNRRIPLLHRQAAGALATRANSIVDLKARKWRANEVTSATSGRHLALRPFEQKFFQRYILDAPGEMKERRSGCV